MSVAAPVVAVGGIVIRRGDPSAPPEVVLVRRSQPPSAGRWSLPGGRVERGERLEDALVRELLEETGLTARVVRLVEVVELIDATFHYVVFDYLCEPTAGELRAGSDVDDARWVQVGEIARFGVTDAVRQVIEQALPPSVG